jgi:2-polyprenyl-6-methoxyphenol hydroxylase-like FAD-dependent oxidoreductase
MGGLTDALWQLFASDAPGARELRNRGLTLVNHLSPLKRWLTARALDRKPWLPESPRKSV